MSLDFDKLFKDIFGKKKTSSIKKEATDDVYAFLPSKDITLEELTICLRAICSTNQIRLRVPKNMEANSVFERILARHFIKCG